MRRFGLCGTAALVCIFLASSVSAAEPTPAELAEARSWTAATFEGVADGQTFLPGDQPLAGSGERRYDVAPFFSFTYDGKPSAELLKAWPLSRASRPLDEHRTEHTLTYTDSNTGLQVRCLGVEYHDFPTIEWTLYFKNTSEKDTPVLSDIQAIDLTRTISNGDPVLHHHVGSPHRQDDYEPLETVLTAGSEKHLAALGGRPTQGDWPYVNLQCPGNQGMVIVVGWPGQWAAQFARDNENRVRIRAGQELTHFKLLPGEEVRSPMIVLQFWKGERLRSQNLWRRWMLAHNMPRPGGKQIGPFKSVCTGNHYPGIITNAAEELRFLRRYVEEKVKPDYWWQDAGWYPCGEPINWSRTGTWEVDSSRWPQGIREVSDWCHSQGIKTILWFEPERVEPNTWLANTHPEWIVGGKQGRLLNLGNPECRAWVVETVDRIMKEQGVDIYRQDFNMDPLASWRAADTEDRQGITEIRHIEGYLAFWDELLRRHPDMFIDSCASGGKRNDLETLRRALPLLRSDYLFEPIGQQCHTYGIASWIPFYGTGFLENDPYILRSQMSPELTMGLDTRRTDQNYDLFRKLVAEWEQIAPCLLGDYYPLTPYSRAQDAWMAWQFNRPEQGDGMVQVFRRTANSHESIHLKLHGLDADSVYMLTDFDVAGAVEKSGRELMEKGLSVVCEKQPQAVVLRYKKKS